MKILDHLAKRFYLVCHDIPDNGEVDTEIGVSQHITQPRDLPPGDLRSLRAQIFWQVFHGFAQEL